MRPRPLFGGSHPDGDQVVRYDPGSGETSVAGRLPTTLMHFSLAWDGRMAYLFGRHVLGVEPDPWSAAVVRFGPT